MVSGQPPTTSDTDAALKAAAVIAGWAARSLSPAAQTFVRGVVADAAPCTPARAKALLFAASKLAGFGERVGLELSAGVLLVPAVVDAKTSYREAWKRSQEQIRRMIPMAKELNVIIAVEEVWNKFLLSPLEFASYVDSFNSPWIRAYFDVGNVVISGYPQDWIRTLGPRIAKLHIKDFKFAKRQAEFVPLREGEIDWLEIHKALGEIGYKGSATVELPAGDEDYLREVSRRFDLILSGA